MPLTAKGEKILAAMQEEYGEEEGERIFYASKNAGTIEGVDAEEWDGVMRTLGVGDKEFSEERRKELAKKGKAMPHGGYPIENEADLKNAIRAFGRAKNKPATKAWIKKRARALGKTELLPENWDELPSFLKQSRALSIKDAWEKTDAMRICPTCDGAGEDEGGFKCETCDGEGYLGIPPSPERDSDTLADRRRRNGEDDEDEDDDDDNDNDFGDSRTIQMSDHFVMDSVRKTANGNLLANARIARTGIQLYRGAEIGLPQMDVVRVYRPPEEVFSKRSMRSLVGIPITLNHPPNMVDTANWKEHSVGETGEEVARDGEYIRVPMMIRDAQAIEAYEKHGVKELSVGYSTELKWGKGKTPDGEIYDAKQTAIRGNHLAVVPAARGGSRLRIGDDQTRGASDMAKILIDGQTIDFADELAAKHVQKYIAGLQKELVDQRKKKEEAEEDEEEEEEKRTRAETDAATLRGEVVALKKQLEDANAKNSGEARAKSIKNSIELLMKANDAMDGKLNFNDCLSKTDAEIHRIVVQAKLGDAAKDMSDFELVGAFKALTANIKPRSGTDRLADSLSLLNFGGGNTNTPKAIKDAAYDEMLKRQTNAWRNPSPAAQ